MLPQSRYEVLLHEVQASLLMVEARRASAELLLEHFITERVRSQDIVLVTPLVHAPGIRGLELRSDEVGA